ncbi:MAG: tRNA uridine-5-carboxymethylaminomethyl(34) synthesis GTPase MnmE [Candidatus Omnitrophica bacterium]|nr:tRNA uridine-5-carboxymethylaminomethyl(34) synthesis GTPase MnmE [Candidatus Omnitrophota bacterium]
MKNDTICAVSTPLGISGIGIVRLSGPDSYKIIGKIFRPAKKINISNIPTHTVHYGYIADGSRTVDEVLLTVMRRPRSYTREDMAEIGCHGGIVPLKEVLSLCIKNGARQAEPGEFTERAFLNGRIDLVQAESVLEVISSKTESALEISVKKLKGSFSSHLNDIQAALSGILAEIEAKINFPEEEEIESLNLETAKKIDELTAFIDGILSRAGRGKILRQGINAAITGRANAGKSSLLNYLVKEDRAIVTDVPGTTRDAVQETVNVRGIPVNIIDTAGIRKVRGRIEKMGVDRAIEWMEKAEVNLIMLDGTKKINDYDRGLLSHIKGKNYIIMINKADMPQKIDKKRIEKDFPSDRIAAISAKTGAGIPELEEKIYGLISMGHAEIKEDCIFLNMRQEGRIKEMRKKLLEIREEIKIGVTADVIAESLKDCLKDIDELTGKNIAEDTLNSIFSRFCIGK